MLSTMPFYPPNSGSRLRVWNLLPFIAKRHKITFLAMYVQGHEPARKDIEQMKSQVHELKLVAMPRSLPVRILNGVKSLVSGRPFTYLNFDFPAFSDAIRQAMRKTDFDLVHTRHIHTLQYLPLFRDKPILLESEGLPAEQWRMYGQRQKNLFRRYFSLQQANLLDKVEIEMHRQCDAVVVCSERDKEVMSKACPKVPYTCVSNGVDTTYFTCPKTQTEPHSLVYTSAFDYVPNADAVVHFTSKVFPRVLEQYPDAKLYLVGKEPVQAVRALASERVIVTGTVEDVRPYVARASVFVVPLRIGQGTRLKVVEAMSMRKAIVSTAVGAEGIAYTVGQDILIADDPADMARAIADLFEDPNKREHMGEAARALAIKCYDWTLWGDAMEQAYQEAMEHAAKRLGKKKTTESITNAQT